jgi:hypothetical protein
MKRITIRGIYRHYRKLDGDSKEYQYDAFVAYSADDYKWVYGPLQTYLEKNQGFKPSSFIASISI